MTHRLVPIIVATAVLSSTTAVTVQQFVSPQPADAGADTAILRRIDDRLKYIDRNISRLERGQGKFCRAIAESSFDCP